MTKKNLFVLLAFSCGLMQAQVGINTVDPKATLHVVPTKTDQSTAEGIIAPNLTRGELISKDPKYTIDQRGAIVYVTTIDGIATTKTANVLTAGYYFFDGNLWQIFSSGGADIPAEPWRVQGSNTEATSNSDNIYQTGSVAIGSNSAGTYKFQVTGNSNITGDSRAGSSTVTGNLNVSKTSTLTGNVGIGAAAGAQKIYITSGGTSSKPVAAVKIIDGNQADGKVLSSDANGVATWQSLPTTANTEPWQVQGGTALSTSNTENIYQTGSVAIGSNSAGTYKLQVTGTSNITGDSRVGSSTVVGNETVGGTLAVTGATSLSNALTVSGTSSLSATNIGGTLNYKPGDIAPTANNYLRTDASGNATWQSLPTTASTEPWQVQGGTDLSTSNTEDIYQTGNVAIGSNSSGTYKFQVTGRSNIIGNLRVESSTVATNQIVTGSVGIGTGTLTEKLNILGNQYTSGISKIGGNTTTTSSAQLELADSNKAFLPNRVALKSSTDVTTVPNPVEGMIVYNTNATTGMPVGLSYYNGQQWSKVVTKLPESSINLLDLQNTCTSTAYIATQTQLGAIINVGSIKIPEDGSYAFAFRLYGSLKTKPPVGNMIFYYIALLANGVLQDTAEMDIIPGSNDNANFLSYSVTLGASLKAGDVVTFRLSHNPASNFPWALIAQPGQKRADRTSMVWWKL